MRSIFATNLRYLRRKHRLTLRSIQRGTGIPKSTLSNWEDDRGNLRLREELKNLVPYFKKIGEKNLSLEKLFFSRLDGKPAPRKKNKIIEKQLELFREAV